MTTESAAEQAVLKWLDPAKLQARFEKGAARLSVRIEGGEELGDVSVAVAFPATAPGRNIELGSSKGEPLACSGPWTDWTARAGCHRGGPAGPVPHPQGPARPRAGRGGAVGFALGGC